VPALSHRKWYKIVDTIKQQLTPEAELCVIVDDGSMTSGQKRNQLTDMARGEYIAFVDDDDTITSDYVQSLVAGCRSGKDVITFDIIRQTDQRTICESFGVQNADHDKRNGVELMTANHLCAWRRDVARRVGWDERLGYADDQAWYKPLVAGSVGLTEHHIPRVLYTYRFDPTNTVNQAPDRRTLAKRLYRHGAAVFRRGSEIYIATESVYELAKVRTVRDRDNQVLPIDREIMEYVTTIHVR